MIAFEKYLKFERHLSEITVKNYFFVIRKFQEFLSTDLFTSSDLTKITQQDVTNFLIFLKNKEISKSSIGLYVIALRTYYKWAYYFYKDEKIGKISFFLNNIVKITRDSKIPVVPTKEEIVKLRWILNQFLQLNSYNKDSRPYRDTLRAYAMIEIFVTAGLRSKELKSLQRKDIDLENKIIFVRKGKGDYQRFSIFGESAVQVLKEYFEIYKFLPDDIIFPMAQQNVINRTIKLWAAKARINPKIHAHSFRHYFITESEKNDVPLEVIADQVGHKDLNSTRHYIHLDIEHIQERYKRIRI